MCKYAFCKNDWVLSPKKENDIIHNWYFVQACVFDWAGTVCDAGVFAPVLTFQKLFEDEGVPITTEEVRAPMGVHKRVRNFI